MSGLPAVLVALLVTLVGGSLIVSASLSPELRGQRGSVATILGVGYLLGVGIVAGGMMLAALLGIPVDHRFALGLLGLLAAASLVRRPWAGFGSLGDGPDARYWVALALLLLAAPNLAYSFLEILTRPLLGWDAWTVWSAKPKTWLGASAQIEFVGRGEWAMAPRSDVHTTHGWHYPELIGRYVLWMGRWAGSWNEHLVHLPWVPLWASLMAATYGLLRLNRCGLPAAATATALLITAPFLSVHMALPGYMDLWIAAEALAACGLFHLWLSHRRAGLLFLAVAMLAMLVGTKVEGLIWAGLIASAAVFAALPFRASVALVIIAVAATGLWWATGGFEVELAGRPWVVAPDLIDLPYVGRFELAFANRLGPFGSALLMLPNWHLLGVLTGVGAVLGLRRSPRDGPYRLCYAYLVLGTLFLFVIFNFTPAGVWAQDLTASNRLTMHMLPAAFWLVVAQLDRALSEETSSA